MTGPSLEGIFRVEHEDVTIPEVGDHRQSHNRGENPCLFPGSVNTPASPHEMWGESVHSHWLDRIIIMSLELESGQRPWVSM